MNNNANQNGINRARNPDGAKVKKNLRHTRGYVLDLGYISNQIKDAYNGLAKLTTLVLRYDLAAVTEGECTVLIYRYNDVSRLTIRCSRVACYLTIFHGK